MKFVISVLLIALLSFALGLYFQWWTLAIAAFAVAALIHQRAGKAFLSGFLALFILWILLAFIVDGPNDHTLSVKIAKLLPLGGNTFLLMLLTGFIGGLVGGFAAMTGSYLRRVTTNK